MTAPKKFVFVLMPFIEEFNDIYAYGIKQTCTELGAYCERVDEQIFHERILDRIYNQISKADILIADMTERNANVFYEVGYAHGLGKKVILLTQNADDIPFDLKHFPHIIYDGKIQKLQSQLKPRLDLFINEEDDTNIIYDFPLQFLINGERIEEGKIFEVHAGGNWSPYINLKIDIFNSSNKIFDSEFKIGIETYSKYGDLISGNETIQISSDRTLVNLIDVKEIYPNFYKEVIFRFNSSEKFSEIFDLQLKIFTRFELKIISFIIKVEDKKGENHWLK